MFDELKSIAGIAALVVSLITSLYAWLTSRSRANSSHLAEVDQNLNDQEARLAKLEGEFEHLPTQESQHQLEKAQVELKGDIKILNEAVRPIAASVRRIEDFLVKEASIKK